MAAINLRQDKERPLTIEEVDHNFDAINREVGTKLNESSFNAVSILEILNHNAGAGSTLDADMLHGQQPSDAAVPNTVVIRDALGNVYAVNFFGVHIGNVIGNVTGDLTGTVTGNSTNVDGVVQIEHGGTGGVTASAARTNLGLGNMAVQVKSAVDITGGTVTGITDLAVADGGTGASNASGARSNLGLAIGVDVQGYSASLAGVAGTTGDGFLARNATNGASTRTIEPGNSIEITNKDGKTGNPTIALTLTPTVQAITKTGTNGTGDIGQADNKFGTLYGTATSAKYADLAEKYTSDLDYIPGTVVVISDKQDSEITQSYIDGQRVLGVISTNPAHVMNSDCDGPPVALRGRVPVKVVGAIRKGQPLVANAHGCGMFGDHQNSFALALETNMDSGVKLVECVIL